MIDDRAEDNPVSGSPTSGNPDSGATTCQCSACFDGCVSCLRNNALAVLTFVAVIIGIALGLLLGEIRTWTKREVMYVTFIGEIFLRMLQCLILPLIVASLVSALGSLDVVLAGKIGLRAGVYYLVTTLMAIALGILLVCTIRPGDQNSLGAVANGTSKTSTLTEDTLLDLVRNVFPRNLVEACVSLHRTNLIEPEEEKNISDTEPNIHEWDFKGEMVEGTNYMGLVACAVILGITIGKMKEDAKFLLDFFKCLTDAMMVITTGVIWLSPLGIFFLVIGKIVEMEDVTVIAGQVGLYTITILAGLFIHSMIVLPGIYFIFIRRNPYIYILNMIEVIATAFGTSSSSATLPITIRCLEKHNGVDPRITRFVLPIGATINMDGTALYEAVAAIFIAQVHQVPLGIGHIVGISVTATAASVGAAGIPQAGLVTMVMVLNVVGLSADNIAIILVVDWFLDRFRTVANVLGDSIGAAVVEKLSIQDLRNHTAAHGNPRHENEN